MGAMDLIQHLRDVHATELQERRYYSILETNVFASKPWREAVHENENE
jgi:hypothetical protein